ncbi:FMN-binding negative transcriptional regulator [Acidihalobacter ferrooxydans]|uniref:Transcriptional regulator n=1 Tax=Acidihalobacter ferrooxydans TaxID=1765967 RepID=A0A1P8UH88_9GAMM|nr:FMN-binding negative transcriptional regulator [Acidihalobacter ferrooxydans]APZ43213.1 hypothetical protein BW247_09005 [Acidihalobacter ferrooxydans]
MYLPEHFKENDAQRITALLREYPFAELVTVRNGAPQITHLPLLYSEDAAGHGWLHGHVARDNPQWRDLAAGGQALAVFNGPHAYISPRYYEKDGVPTWNYAVAHVRGRGELLEDRQALSDLLDRLTATFEAEAGAAAWRWRDYAERFDGMLDHIVGFVIAVESIEAKFKLGQNRAEVDQRKVREKLTASADTGEQALGLIMRI